MHCDGVLVVVDGVLVWQCAALGNGVDDASLVTITSDFLVRRCYVKKFELFWLCDVDELVFVSRLAALSVGY
jgi:hypothetical protein